MWVILAVVSALCLGFYDIFKKISVRENNVLMVLMLNTVFGALYMSPVIIGALFDGNYGFGNTAAGHLRILLKAFIVLGSWLLGYFAIKHLPLTIQGPINASRPVMVLVGALLIFGESLNLLQWSGIALGFLSLFFISRIGAKEGLSLRHSRWIWMSIGATVLGAVSALYDKYLLRQYQPAEVQAWYSLYQCAIMVTTILIIRNIGKANGGRFIWRWSIPCIALFLTIADLAYFYSLSKPGSMIAVVSMIRRGSVLVSFFYGVVMLHEKNIRAKAVDLSVLMLSLALLVIGSL
ncbi:MAG: DMT family transporter [Muribaculaceae bacterium]|nr:DMT family transporter [Muribaculaceae bacterium]